MINAVFFIVSIACPSSLSYLLIPITSSPNLINQIHIYDLLQRILIERNSRWT